MKSNGKTGRNPWAWIPTLYLLEGLPYVAVMTISVIMYKRLGISNTDIALYTGWLYLPWVIKPFWSPFVDIFKSKRWWILTMQWILAISFAAIAFLIPTPLFFQLTLAVFWVTAFTSATHDIAADGFYMLALTEHEQSLYVGIRSTFYRIATVAGQGLLVIIAGVIEMNSGLEPLQLTVNADPAAQYSPAVVQWIDDIPADLSGEMQFFSPTPEVLATSVSPASVTVGADEVDFKSYSAMMRDSVRHLNEANGFIPKRVENTAATAAATKDEDGWFTAWVRNTFGEERRVVADATNNFVVVPVVLTRPVAAGDSIVLNFNFDSGDQSIKLSGDCDRLVFTGANSGKTAYLLFEIDHKLKGAATTTFKGTSGNIPFAWLVVFGVLSALFFATVLYHSWALPRPASDKSATQGRSAAKNVLKEFIATFKSFFKKPQIGTAIAFMLLYRLPEAQLVKLINPFLLDPIDKGGLGLTTGEVGFVYGTIGIIGLTLGGIIGGIVAAKGGLRKWLKPMAWSMSLTCLTFVYLSYFQDHSLLTVNICVFIEQFGYGFGFTAYMLYLIYFSEGEYKTSHYAICTGFMALGMMLPGMAAGWLQDTIGYRHFFVWTMICCVATIGVCYLLKINPEFGRKKKE